MDYSQTNLIIPNQFVCIIRFKSSQSQQFSRENRYDFRSFFFLTCDKNKQLGGHVDVRSKHFHNWSKRYDETRSDNNNCF